LYLNDNKLSGSIPDSIKNLNEVLEYDYDSEGFGFINLGNNYFTFNGMESFAEKFGRASSYSPQANILFIKMAQPYPFMQGNIKQ
jgi:hypothetical protein